MSLFWYKRIHTIILRQYNPQFMNLERFLPSYKPRMDVGEAYYDEIKEDPSLITVPLKLKSRLLKKEERANTKAGIRRKTVESSRKGSKQAVLTAKRPDLNHYKGQSYGRNEEIPLISKGWRSRKSKGDFFTIHPLTEDPAFIQLDNREVFQSLGIDEKICSILQVEKIEKPTLIQATAIPEILKGTNNLLAAETGCGKTLAYLLPILQQLTHRSTRIRRKPNQPACLILVPTRELADQVHKVAGSIGYLLGIRVKLIQGGNIHSKATNPSTKDCDIIVSTINVISALSALEVYDLSQVRHVVLDEADTLMDDSFSPEVLRFLGRFQFDPASNKQVQMTLVSATMPRSIETILDEVIPMDSLHRITTPGLHSCIKIVPQKFLRIRKMDKPDLILNLVQESLKTKSPVMIFGNRGETCHWVGEHLTTNGIDCVTVHGKFRPHVRKGLLDQYQNGDVDVIVCTDVGSRGIDTTRTKHVVNYDFPRFLADYVHRCGRVGRVGSSAGGKITNFISGAHEVEVVQQIETAVRKNESMDRVNANIKRILNAKYGMYKTIDPISDKENE